jgi:tetratricopeptide (TPR) repeat protein
MESAARAIVRGAAECRKDAALALAFYDLASKLAPDEPTVAVAHVEALLAANQRGDAAARLDKLLERHPDEARARLMRGKLAAQEGEHELAVKLFAPLEADPAWRDQVAPLADKSRAALKEKKDAEQDLAFAAAQAHDQAKAADKAAKGARPSGEAGKLVTSLKGKVSLGGDHSFTVKQLRKGQSYVFRAVGECQRKKPAARRHRSPGLTEDPKADVFGVDFAVQFGKQDPNALSAGQPGEHDRNEIPFVADSDGMAIRVFDRSSGLDKGVSCTFTDFAVLAQ